MKKEKGFTLIEILIVVAIIAILASVVLVGLGPTQRAGRDARRLSDLHQVQNGLELYFNRCGFYPGGAQASAGACATVAAVTTWVAMTAALTGTTGIGVTNVPNDPNTSAHYDYGATPANSATTYTLRAALEDPNNSALATDIDAADSNNLDCTDSPIAYYCLSL